MDIYLYIMEIQLHYHSCVYCLVQSLISSPIRLYCLFLYLYVCFFCFILSAMLYIGINGVISSVTIEALNHNCSVLGFFEGFKQLKAGRSMVTPLEWDVVTRIYNTGGSMLRTSKQQIKTAQELDNCIRVLQHHRVKYLVTIGGTQTGQNENKEKEDEDERVENRKKIENKGQGEWLLALNLTLLSSPLFLFFFLFFLYMHSLSSHVQLTAHH